VFAEDEAALLLSAAGSAEELDTLVAARVSGRPLEHVLGWAEFCGIRIDVDPGVFVPRPRTELLVRETAALARPGDLMVDLCCGSGAVSAAVAATVGALELYAVDVDAAAVRCAARNLAPAGGRVLSGDLFEPLPARLRERVRVLVANAPYVPTDAVDLLPAEARLHEPRVALDGGSDGLGVLRRVVDEAPRWLAPGGAVLVESSQRQAPSLVEAVAGVGLIPRVAVWDDRDATVVIASRPGRL
jgi:release factor glutamine methyltransferase